VIASRTSRSSRTGARSPTTASRARCARASRSAAGSRSSENLGYVVEWRELRACDYGAPTTRKRLFLIARCDGAADRVAGADARRGRALPWRTAAECIDWSIPCPSIFEREARSPRTRCGASRAASDKYVIDAANPFIVPPSWRSTTAGTRRRARRSSCRSTPSRRRITTPSSPRASRRCAARTPASRTDPLQTISAQGTHFAEVRAFLVAYYGNETREGRACSSRCARSPRRTGFGLVTVHGEDYAIVDIGMRMLQPRELFRAQGFPDTYRIDPTPTASPSRSRPRCACAATASARRWPPRSSARRSNRAEQAHESCAQHRPEDGRMQRFRNGAVYE
jgi:DNA (cytosine-5)-methyltransferase 1